MRRVITPCLLSILTSFNLFSSNLLAQNSARGIKFERLSHDQGLSLNAIHCILQDRQGFLWFATEIGLHKYDGYNFTVYYNDSQDSSSLPDNQITALYEDRSGTLWIGTGSRGLNRFNRETEQFTRFGDDPQNANSLSSKEVRSIYEDSAAENTLWIGTDNGLYQFDRSEEQFTVFVNDPKNSSSLSDNRILSIYEDHTGTLWIGTATGLNKFDRDKEQFIHFFHNPNNPYSLSSNSINTIYEDFTGILWIGTAGGGINKFDREKKQFTHFVNDPKNPHSLSSNTIREITEGPTGTLWIGTLNGLNKLVLSDSKGFDRGNERFTHFVNDPRNSNSLSHNYIQALYQDRSGILWVGTTFGTLNKFDRGKELFAHFANDPYNSNSLSSNFVWSITTEPAAPNTIWIGTLGGLNKLDRDTGQFTHFMHDPKNPHSLSHNGVQVIYMDRAGTLWVGTRGGGLNKFDREKEQFKRYQHDPKNLNSLSSNLIYSIFEDRDGMLWIGTAWDGLNRFNPKLEQFTRFVNDPKNPNSLSSSEFSLVCEDHTGTLWVGTDYGLNKFDREKGQFTRFYHDPRNPHSLSQNVILSLSVDHFGTLWIGTSNGLNKFDRDKEQFTHYTEKDGLLNNGIAGILEDDNGHLWVSNDKGLFRFDPKTEIFRNYNVSDGLQSNNFWGRSCHKSSSGEMFFGGINGFNAFHPDSIKDNPYIPPVVITAFKRYNLETEGKPIIEKGISAKQHITLSYKDNVLAFEFAALSYRNTLKNQYAYKLEGFNDNWIQLGTKRDVTFTNLDPGEYTLRVKGSNNDGVWNEEGTSLKITITPPWWQTRWAYAFYGLLFMLSLYGWRRFELNRVKLRNELKMKNFEAQKLKEIDGMKSRFFSNISHEFRTPLTLILGPVEQMRGNEFKGNWNDGFDMILRNGRRLLRLINQLLDLARLEAGGMSLQARPENIISFLKGLVLSFASAAERKRLHLSISAAEENRIVYFDRDKLEKIVSNLLSNALKFTPEGGEVEVLISTVETTGPVVSTNGYIEISVKDTGPGIPADQRDKIFDRFYQIDPAHTSTSSVREHEGTGIGLALTKELVELHHGEILVESEIERGTTFIVRLPLGKAHLRPEEVASDQLSVSSDQFSRIEDRESKIEDRATSNELKRSAEADFSEKQVEETIVLVVEDNRDVCTYIRQYLEPTFTMIEAHDGMEGVAKALEIIPDLIISDVMMPKRDGNELCRVLKADEKTSHVPIIMLTAKADRDSKVQGLEIGADDYLIKPFDSKELLARVHNLIKLRRQLRERFSREVVLKPQDIAITPMDEVFLNKVKAVVEAQLSDEDFEIEALGRKVGMSRSQIHRKLKALTNQSASQFIRSMRLQRAVELLKQNAGTVAEIAYQVGFGSQAYFTKCFHEQFGCSPKEYIIKKNS